MRKNVNNKNDFIQLIQYIINFWDLDRMKAIFTEYQQGDYLAVRIDKFTNLFWEEYEISENNWIIAIENFIGTHSIPIMTIHKSKGLEYSAVYFVGLEDAAFWNFKNQPDEDRCAFFVALSRAKEFLMFTFCQYRSNLQYPRQRKDSINEFYEVLTKAGMAEII